MMTDKESVSNKHITFEYKGDVYRMTRDQLGTFNLDGWLHAADCFSAIRKAVEKRKLDISLFKIKGK